MGGFLYLYKTTLKNRTVKALKRPVTYIYVLLFGWQAWAMTFGLGTIIDMLHLNQPEGFAAALTLIMFLIVPANLVAYSKRKGLVFRPSEVHFVFTAPVKSKMVLLYAHVKTILISIIPGAFAVVLGSIYCKIPIVSLLIFFVFSVIIENILEASIMIILYGNESIPEKFLKKIPYFMYGIMIVFYVTGFIFITTHGFSIGSLQEYLSIPWIQCVPIIGWYIAFVRLLFVGPTLLNVICAMLYSMATIILAFYAYRMKCTGEYYEDAMKFAEDYQEIRKKAKKGEVAFLGKKKKYVNAVVDYKGSFAKAIFYRQLLEYKKNKFFIFGANTLLLFIVGIGIAVFAYFNPDIKEMKEFVIVGVASYTTFIFSGYRTKWTRELENPYTFLIPDSSFRKVWYATIIEHIRAAVDGCLLTIVPAIYLRIHPINIILIIIIYVCLQANKLYAEMFAEYIAGSILGKFAKNMIKMLIQVTVIIISILASVLAVIYLGVQIGFVILMVVATSLTIIISLGAVALFDKMETGN